MQVVEELHLARSKNSLEVTVTHSYGELTCMDIDLTEDGAANTHCECDSTHSHHQLGDLYSSLKKTDKSRSVFVTLCCSFMHLIVLHPI